MLTLLVAVPAGNGGPMSPGTPLAAELPPPPDVPRTATAGLAPGALQLPPPQLSEPFALLRLLQQLCIPLATTSTRHELAVPERGGPASCGGSQNAAVRGQQTWAERLPGNHLPTQPTPVATYKPFPLAHCPCCTRCRSRSGCPCGASKASCRGARWRGGRGGSAGEGGSARCRTAKGRRGGAGSTGGAWSPAGAPFSRGP